MPFGNGELIDGTKAFGGATMVYQPVTDTPRDFTPNYPNHGGGVAAANTSGVPLLYNPEVFNNLAGMLKLLMHLTLVNTCYLGID